jgi:hypothetical protein
VSREALLLMVVQLLGGGAVGYLVGLWQGRKQTQYQRRVEVVTELRMRLREARESFANMATPPEYRLPEDQFRAEEVEEAGKKLDALAGYFEDNANWLDGETRERLDELADELAFLWAEVRGRLDAREDPARPLRAAWDWLEAADEEIEEINERFDRTLGTHAPWWRRGFGG